MATRIEVGLSSFAYRWALELGALDPWSLIERAVQREVDVLQFLHNVPLHEWADEDLRALGEAAGGRVRLEVGTHGLDPARLARYVQVARLCGAGLVRATAFGDLEAGHRALRDLLPSLRASGVTVALENYPLTSSADLARLVRRLDDPHVGVCLDTLNSVGRFESPAETMFALAPNAVSLHLKDGVARPADHGLDVVGTAVGDGLLDMPALLRIVWGTGIRPPMLVELWHERAEDDAATIAAEERSVTRSLECVRRLASLAPE